MKIRNIADVTLRPFVKLTLQSWYDGSDVSLTLPRRTFYKYRKEILHETGIDISMSYREQNPDAKPTLLGMDELKKREVKIYPDRIQASLFGAGR